MLVVVVWMEIGDGVLVNLVGDEVLLVLGEVPDGCWTIVCSWSEIWIGWLVGCVGELLLVVAVGLMELVEWVTTFPNKFGADAWVG